MQVDFHSNNHELKESVHNFISEWKNDAKTIVVNTSGSTGKPKQIPLEKKYMEASARMTAEFLQLKPGHTALLCLSPNTIAGKMMIVRSLVVGMNLIVADVNSSPLNDLNRQIDFTAMVPLQVEKSIDEEIDKLLGIDKLIIGGGPISHDLRLKISNIGVQAYQTFGMTETISHIAMRRISQEDTPYSALPGIEVESFEGRLKINASSLGVNELITNDLIHIIERDSFRWLGRSDFVINSGGIKIHPEQIEAKLAPLIKTNFFATGLPHDHLGEQLVICVEESGQDWTKNDFSTYLDSYQIPKEIYFFERFTYTESGKINRSKTLEQLDNAEKQVL